MIFSPSIIYAFCYIYLHEKHMKSKPSPIYIFFVGSWNFLERVLGSVMNFNFPVVVSGDAGSDAFFDITRLTHGL